jgi:type IX secretion system PorP/SprF family membrane protein
MDMLRSFVRSILLAALLPLSGFAQQIQMNTPFLLNRNYINPSYNGILDFHQFDFFMGSKSKWNGVPGSPTVNAAHAMAKFSDKHSGGIQLVEHAFATFNYKSFALPYSFTAKFNEDHALKLGLATRFIQSNIDFSNAITEMTIEPAKDNYSRLTVFLDANAGMSYHFKDRFSMGLAMTNFVVNGSVNEPDLLNYASYSLLQGTADLHYKFYKSERNSSSFDALVTTNGAMPATYQLYLSTEQKIADAKALLGIGYKSTGDLVTILRIHMPKFYYLYTFETPVLGQQLTAFTGNYVGFGYKFTAP